MTGLLVASCQSVSFPDVPKSGEKAYAWLDQPVPFYATAQPPCLGPKASSLECLVAIPSSGSHHPHLHVAVSITFNSVLTSVRHF